MSKEGTALNNMNKTASFQHAIVIGGSIAGLSAARILTEFFEQVTIIERDLYPEGVEPRKGTPQSRQPHAILKRGQLNFEELFPGFTDELMAHGAINFNMGNEVRWHMMGQWRPQYKSEMECLGCSRPLIETTIRRRMFAHPQVRFIQEAEVIGLETSADNKQVAGVRVRLRGENNRETSFQADLVVDTSGRSSNAPEWLTALGYAAPEETIIDGKAGYATRIFKRPTSHVESGLRTLYLQPLAPNHKRGAIMLPIEGGELCYLTLIGFGGDYPPTDEAGFLEYARSLPTPEIYDFINESEPVTPIIGYRNLNNRLRHYDKLETYLEGFLALGDSAFAFNPVYGQGMSIASVTAIELRACLTEHLAQRSDLIGLAENFQKRLPALLAIPWQMSTGEDLNWFPAENPAPLDPEVRMMGQYMEKVMIATMSNPNVTDAFYKVMNLMESPNIFFRPDIVLQVMDAVLVKQ